MSFYVLLCIFLKISSKGKKKLTLTLKSSTGGKNKYSIGQIAGIILYLIECILKIAFAY